MKLNQQTERFLSIYQSIIGKHGIKSDKLLCDKILKWSNATFSQAKKSKRNIPDVVLYRFIKHFKIKDSIIFETPHALRSLTEIHKQKNGIIEFQDGTLKKIINRSESEGFTILILK